MRITTLLKSYKENTKLVKLLETQIAEMTSADSDAGITHDTILDYRFNPEGTPKHIVGFNEQEYERKRKKLREARKEILAAEEWIAGIEDGITREVFHARYIQGWTWAKVAQSMGYRDNEDYPRLHVHDDYLKKMGHK